MLSYIDEIQRTRKKEKGSESFLFIFLDLSLSSSDFFGIPAIIYGLRDKEDEWSLAGMIMGVCACIVLTINAVLSIMSLF